MTLSRFTIRKSDFPKAIKYLSKEGAFKKDTPSWVVKNKDKLQVVNGKVRYNDLEIVPSENLDAYLRKILFDQNSKIPASRDGMFHLLKSKVANVSRRKIMNFLRGQSVVIKGKPSVPVPKLGGRPLKTHEIEFDLVFLKKRDVVNANKYFDNDITLDGKDNNGLTYIVSVVEKASGLTRIGFSSSKESAKVTPIVIRLMKEIAKSLKLNLKTEITASSDKGTEFSQKDIEKVVKSYKRVPTGPSVEKKNSDLQRVLFQRLRARAGKDIHKLLQSTEHILNNNFNKITKMTANEASKEEKNVVLKKYNKKRTEGEDGKQLNVGDYVRIRKLKVQKDKQLDYKSYKNQLWSKKVYRIGAKTKKKPAKYRVGKRWLLTGMLMLVRPTDEVSEGIIKHRDEKQQKIKDKEADEHMKRREKEIQVAKEKKAKEIKEIEEKVFQKTGGRRRSRRTGAILGRQKKLAADKKDAANKKLIG
jgi:hypothetical protein